MLERLIALGEKHNKIFGVKLINTFPVQIHIMNCQVSKCTCLVNPCYPITIGVAELLSAQFGEALPMSYSGGAVKQNIKAIFDCGIWPVTVCTILLQGEGYNTFKGLADEVESTDYNAALKVHKDLIAKLTKDISEK